MSSERRQHRRLALHLPVFLYRPDDDYRASGETVNISTEGFYCTTKEPFAPGERLRCKISFPSSWPDHAQMGLSIEADVEVLRVAATESEGFGIGCRIRDYRIDASEEAH